MHAAVVNDWAEGPRYTDVPDAAAPPEGANEVRLRVLAAGAHQLVRSRAAGQHYSSGALPHRVGVDCVAEDEATGQRYYCASFAPGFGTFADRIVVPRSSAVPLPPGADPAAFAATVNPAMSSWMALRHRVFGLASSAPSFSSSSSSSSTAGGGGGGFSVLIIGATSASGRVGAQIARSLGATRVAGAARDAAALDAVPWLDDRLVLRPRPEDTDASGLGPVDVVLDYVYGPAALSVLSTLNSAGRPVQYVQIGSVGGSSAEIPASLLRSRDLTVRGAGPGSWSLEALGAEMRELVPAMAAWTLEDPLRVPLADIERTWGDAGTFRKGRRVVYVP